MNVALVYNQKKDDTSLQSEENDSTEPPSSKETQFNARDLSPSHLRSIQSVSDLYAEWDTAETINAVQTALEELHHVTLIEANEFAFERLRDERPEIVFNIAEGLYGISREAQVPACLEMLQIPYTGSDPLTLAICLDKSRTKEILAYYHIPTPRFIVGQNPSEVSRSSLNFPLMVKPLHEGSSKGIFNSSVVRSGDEMAREMERIVTLYNEPALIEEYLTGREFTVALMGNGEEVSVLPIVEIKFDSLPPQVNPIYSFEAKWIWDRRDAPLDIFECPAAISLSLQKEIEEICRKAYRVLRCRDWCRIDVRLDAAGKPQILELNPLPGILPNPKDNSCFPKAARVAGLSYSQLIQGVLALAAQRSRLVTQKPAVLYQES